MDWYDKLFHDQMILDALYTTLAVSVLAAVIATVAGTFAAIGFYNMKKTLAHSADDGEQHPHGQRGDRHRRLPLPVLRWPFSTFGGFCPLVNGAFGLQLPEQLYLGFGTMLIAHITFNIPYVILSIMPKLRQMDKNLVDAAQDLGCTWMQAFWKVVVPEIKPGIINGLLIAFTMSVDDFVISYFTAGSSTANLAMRIYAMTKKRISPEVNAVSTLLFVTVLVLLVIINVREARQERAAAKQRIT